MKERRHDMGEGGFCLCTKCGTKVAHQPGLPCQEERCPDCGSKMLREGSFHHQLFEEKQAKTKRQQSSGSSESESS